MYLPNNIQVDLHKNVISVRVLHDDFVNTFWVFFFVHSSTFSPLTITYAVCWSWCYSIMFMYHGTLAFGFRRFRCFVGLATIFGLYKWNVFRELWYPSLGFGLVYYWNQWCIFSFCLLFRVYFFFIPAYHRCTCWTHDFSLPYYFSK